MGLLTIWD